MITQYMTANKLPRLETFAILCKEPDLSPAYILEERNIDFVKVRFLDKVADVALSVLQIQCPVLHKEKKDRAFYLLIRKTSSMSVSS